MKRTFLRYGKTTIPLRVPDRAHILQAKAVSALPNPQEAVSDALQNPIASASLMQKLQAKQPRNAVVTISDITRPVPNKHILPSILKTLHEFGLGKCDITILVATGMHRPSTDTEKAHLVGDEIVANYQIVGHHSERAEELVELPRPSVKGTRAFINALYMKSDFKIVTGFIEPHFMAGFSGGRKGVCPGLANVETVQKFHGFHFLDSPNAANCILDGNPLHEEAMDVAEMAGIDFLVNVGLDEEKQIAAVFAGDWREAFFSGAKQVKDWVIAECPEECDFVIACGGGEPLDKTLYQTGKGMCSVLPVLKQNGTAVIASACSEGVGSPSFSQIMRDWGKDWKGFLNHIKTKPDTTHDQWGFQMHTKVLQKTGGPEHLLFASEGIPAGEQRNMSLNPLAIADIQSVIAGIPSASSLAVIPDGPYTVASLASS